MQRYLIRKHDCELRQHRAEPTRLNPLQRSEGAVLGEELRQNRPCRFETPEVGDSTEQRKCHFLVKLGQEFANDAVAIGTPGFSSEKHSEWMWFNSPIATLPCQQAQGVAVVGAG
jgi:hypothetical protein